MGQHTITAVSSDVSEWDSKYGPMKTYKVRFADTKNTIIQIAQKASTRAPEKGDEVEGSIDMSAQYGPKFTKPYTPQGGSGGSRPAYQPKDEKAISAMWSIGQAVQLYLPQMTAQNRPDFSELEEYAQELFNMVDRVKATPPDLEVETTQTELSDNIDETMAEEDGDPGPEEPEDF